MAGKDLSKLPVARGHAYYVEDSNGRPWRHPATCGVCPPPDYSRGGEAHPGEVIPIYDSRQKLWEAGWTQVRIPRRGNVWCCPECSKESEGGRQG